MNRTLALFPSLVALLAAASPIPPPTDGGCSCPAAQLANGWCHACKVGYVASLPIKSEILFEALDPHGHELDPALMPCSECKAAFAADTQCKVHRIGFVDRQAYFSKLTYALAKGQVRDVSTITCERCKSNALRHTVKPTTKPDAKKPASDGWCDICKIGMVGNVEFRKREDFDLASAEFRKLIPAAKTAERCGRCAYAQLYDGTCRVCAISYRGGKKLRASASPQRRREHREE